LLAFLKLRDQVIDCAVCLEVFFAKTMEVVSTPSSGENIPEGYFFCSAFDSFRYSTTSFSLNGAVKAVLGPAETGSPFITAPVTG
jgi:hypothetical protein